MSATEPLEPHARHILETIANGDAPPGASCADAYAVSVAISLKRIADRLEAVTLVGQTAERSWGQVNVGADCNCNVSLNG